MSAYSELTNNQLKRKIAELIGYRIEHHEHTSRLMAPDNFWIEEECWLEGDKPGFVVLFSNRAFEEQQEGFDTEDEAWDDVFMRDDCFRSAQTLISYTRGNWIAKTLSDGMNFVEVTTKEGATGESMAAVLDRAIYEAWLVAKEKE